MLNPDAWLLEEINGRLVLGFLQQLEDQAVWRVAWPDCQDVVLDHSLDGHHGVLDLEDLEGLACE